MGEAVTATVLRSLDITTSAHPGASARVCVEHLRRMGARHIPAVSVGVAPGGAGEAVRAAAKGGDTVECAIGWCPAGADAGYRTEAAVQAACGVMEVHGRSRGRPRRLGLDVASFCAGVLASQAILAALFAARRGLRITGMVASVVDGALTLMTHHLAYATCNDDWMVPLDAGTDGPPFCTAEPDARADDYLWPRVRAQNHSR